MSGARGRARDHNPERPRVTIRVDADVRMQLERIAADTERYLGVRVPLTSAIEGALDFALRHSGESPRLQSEFRGAMRRRARTARARTRAWKDGPE